MKTRTLRIAALSVLLVLSVGVTSGCKSLPKLKFKPHWPWSSKPAPAEPQANQVAWEAPEGAAAGTPAVEFPQTWSRNTLVIDMSGASGSGSVRMHAKASMGWPVRMALRVRPGSIASVEIQAEQRVVIPVLPDAGASVDLPIDPGVYLPKTPTITLSWR